MDFIREVIKYRNSDKIAVVSGDEKTTYKTLINNALRFAFFLSENGIDSVIIKTARSTNAITAALGTIFSGGVFAFLSHSSPSENIKNAAEDLSAKIIIDDDINFDEIKNSPSDFSPQKREVSAPICAVFTSGSTGRPKGALLTYRGLCETVSWQTEYMKTDANSHTGSYAEFSFIASFWEIWYPLANGFTLHIADNKTRLDTHLLCEFINKNNISYIFLPSGVAEIFSVVYSGGALRFLRVAGGRLAACDEPKGYEILYSLGMSENSGSVTFSSIKKAMSGNIPIGKPFGSTEIYLIDGEMAVSGPSLFVGYAGREDLTERVLIDNPNANGRDLYTKMYISGDLAHMNNDGDLVYDGRRDWIVKINNIKTNPLETERVINEMDGVFEAAVCAFYRVDKSAYLTCFFSGDIASEALKNKLSEKLTPNEIPSLFIKMDTLPRNSNGKIDRSKLTMNTGKSGEKNFATEKEKIIAAAFEKILGLEDGTVGADDHFTSLGGSSLMLMRLQAELIKSAEIHVSYSDIFIAGTPRAIANLSGEKRLQILDTKPQMNMPYPLTAPERQMWMLWRTGQDNGRYTVRIRCDFDGEINLEKADIALLKLVENNPILSSVYTEINGQPARFFTDEKIKFGDNEPATFDISKGPIFAATLKHKSLIFTAHHIIADAVAMRVLIEDFWCLYFDKTPYYAAHFHDIENFSQTLSLDSDETYWAGELTGFKYTPFPTETVSKTREFVIDFTENEIKKITEFASENSVTLFVLFTAAAAKLTSKIIKADSVAIGIPLSGRDLPETIRTVGMLVRTLPLIIPTDGTFTETVKSTNEKLKEATIHQIYPFCLMNEKYGIRYDVMVNSVPLPQKIEDAETLSPRIIRGSYPAPAAKLVIDLREETDGFSAVFTYDSYEEKTIKNWAGIFRKVLLEESAEQIIIPQTVINCTSEIIKNDDFSEIWNSFFGVFDGNFYYLGGTSLKAIQIEEAMLLRGQYISAADILSLQNFDEIVRMITPAEDIDWEADL